MPAAATASRSKRAARLILRLVAGLVGVVLVAALGLWAVARSRWGRELIRQRVERALNGRLATGVHLQLGPIEQLRLSEVAVGPTRLLVPRAGGPGAEPVASVQQARVEISPREVLRSWRRERRVPLRRVQVRGLWLRAERDGGGRWNLDRILPATPPMAGSAVPVSEPRRTGVSLESVEVDGRLELALPPGGGAGQASRSIELPLTLGGHLTLEPGGGERGALRLALGQARLTVSGSHQGRVSFRAQLASPTALTARVAAALGLEGLRGFEAEGSLEGDPAGELAARLELRPELDPEGHISVRGHLRPGEGWLDGTVVVERTSPQAWLEQLPPGRLHASAHLRLRRAAGHVRARLSVALRRSRLAAIELTSGSLEATLTASADPVVTVHRARLRLPAGLLDLRGQLGLGRGAVSDLKLGLDLYELQRLPPVIGPARGEVHLTARMTGPLADPLVRVNGTAHALVLGPLQAGVVELEGTMRGPLSSARWQGHLQAQGFRHGQHRFRRLRGRIDARRGSGPAPGHLVVDADLTSTRGARAELALSGTFDERAGRAELRRLELALPGYRLGLVSPVSVVRQGSGATRRLVVPSLRLARPGRRHDRLALALSYPIGARGDLRQLVRDGTLDLTLERLALAELAGAAEGMLEAASRSRWPGALAGPLDARVVLQRSQLRFSLEGRGPSGLRASGALRLDPGSTRAGEGAGSPVQLHLLLPTQPVAPLLAPFPALAGVRGDVGLELHLGGSVGRPELRASLHLRRTAVGPVGALTGSLQLTQMDGQDLTLRARAESIRHGGPPASAMVEAVQRLPLTPVMRALLAGDLTRARQAVQTAVGEGRFSARASVSGLTLADLPAPWLAPLARRLGRTPTLQRADLTLRAAGTLAQPAIEGGLSLVGVGLAPGLELDLSFDARLDPGRTSPRAGEAPRLILGGRATRQGQQVATARVTLTAPARDAAAPTRGLLAAWRWLGPLGAPRIEARLTLQGLSTRRPLQVTPGPESPSTELDLTASLEGPRATVELMARQQGRTALSARVRLGELPRIEDARRSPGRWRQARIESEVRASRLSLGFLGGLLPGGAEVGGEVDARLTIDGTVERPLASGELHLSAATLRLPSLGQSYEKARVDLRLTPSELTLERVRLQSSPAGLLEAHGTVHHQYLRPKSFKLQVDARRFAAPTRTGLYALVDLLGRLRGSIQGEKLQGEVVVDRALIEVPDQGRRAVQTLRPMEGVVIHVPGAAAPEPRVQERPTGPLQAARVRLSIPRRFRVKGKDFSVDLKADLLAKLEGSDLRVDGRAEVISGRARVLGREFTVERASVTFDGVDPSNPHLEVVATHQVADHTVKVLIGGTARNPTLELTSDPPVGDQTATLSLLLTGAPDAAPGADQALGQRAGALLANLAAGRLRDQVGRLLPVDVIRIDAAADGDAGGLIGSRVEVGTFVADHLYVAYAHRFAPQPGENRNEALVRYRFRARWTFESRHGDAGDGAVGIFWTHRY